MPLWSQYKIELLEYLNSLELEEKKERIKRQDPSYNERPGLKFLVKYVNAAIGMEGGKGGIGVRLFEERQSGDFGIYDIARYKEDRKVED